MINAGKKQFFTQTAAGIKISWDLFPAAGFFIRKGDGI
jgi:hypothetical protein